MLIPIILLYKRTMKMKLCKRRLHKLPGTIGLLLCVSKSKIKVEYAMRRMDLPLGVATYELEQFVKDAMPMIESHLSDEIRNYQEKDDKE